MVSSLILTNCRDSKECKNDLVAPVIDNQIKKSKDFTKDCFIDEYLNDSIQLWNSDDICSAFGSLKGKVNQRNNDNSDIYFKDKANNTYLRLIYMGEYDSTYKYRNHENFGACEIGYLKDLKNIKIFKTEYKTFKSGEGIELGMKQTDFLNKYKIFIDKTDTLKDGFVFYHDCPGYTYYSEYKFKKNKLVKFTYGFFNP